MEEVARSWRCASTTTFAWSGRVEVPADGTLLGLLDAAAWLDGLRLTDCLDDGDLIVIGGVMLIDELTGTGNCSDVEGDIKDNIDRSGELRATP
jgi:hypothetical protein